jgi:glycosyltransferase involved in cell wall biosynthesis
MRIGIDARLWNETGVGRYIRNLVWELQKLDKKNNYVLFLDKKAKLQDIKIKERWKIVETDIRWHTIKEQRLFPKILEKENLDLMHFPYFSVPIFYSGPFVITIHDLIIHHYPTGKASTLPSPVYYVKRFGYKYVIKQAAQKAEKIVTVSQATKDEIIKHLGVRSDKIVVTYEGVEDTTKFTVQRSQGEFKNEKYFLYVGNAYPHKNLDYLAEVFKLIFTEFPDIKLVFVGKKDYFYARLQEKVKNLGIEKNTVFTGFISEKDLQQYYTNAIATIQPSLMEGFGLTGLEAMSNNCLVLASDIPSLKEIYGDAAVYFDPLAVESLRATIREVLSDGKSFQSLLSHAKKRVSNFSWDEMAEQTLKLYESCSRVRSDQ